jgi:hypothetical protein
MSYEDSASEMLRRVMYIGQLLASVTPELQVNAEHPRLSAKSVVHEGNPSTASKTGIEWTTDPSKTSFIPKQ